MAMIHFDRREGIASPAGKSDETIFGCHNIARPKRRIALCINAGEAERVTPVASAACHRLLAIEIGVGEVDIVTAICAYCRVDAAAGIHLSLGRRAERATRFSRAQSRLSVHGKVLAVASAHTVTYLWTSLSLHRQIVGRIREGLHDGRRTRRLVRVVAKCAEKALEKACGGRRRETQNDG